MKKPWKIVWTEWACEECGERDDENGGSLSDLKAGAKAHAAEQVGRPKHRVRLERLFKNDL